MSKYIDYDAIDYRNDRLHDKSEEFLNGVIYMAQRIEEAPSIEIVRCGECKYGGTEDCPMDEIDDEYFCNFGERQTERSE